MNGGFVDLYHDGTLELVSVGEYPPPLDGSAITAPDLVYRLVGGFLVLDKPLIVVFSSIERETGAPQTFDLPFSNVAGTSGPYILSIVNGDKAGRNRLSSAALSLNGREVVSTSEFNQQVEFISVNVQLQSQNILHVTLYSKPGAKLVIIIQGS